MKFHLQMLTLQLEKLQRNSPTRLLCRFRRGSFWNEWRVANRNGSRCCQCEKIEKKPRSPVRYMGCKNTDNKLFTFSKSYREEEVTLRCVWRSGDHTTIFAALYNYHFNFFYCRLGRLFTRIEMKLYRKVTLCIGMLGYLVIEWNIIFLLAMECNFP